MSEERNLPLEIFDDIKDEVTTLDIILALGLGLSANLLVAGLYLWNCQRNKGILIKGGK